MKPKPRSRIQQATILLPLAALAFVILYGVFGVGRDTRPRIHDLRNPKACAECHVNQDAEALRQPLPALCLRCHEELTPDCGGEASDCLRCHSAHGK